MKTQVSLTVSVKQPQCAETSFDGDILQWKLDKEKSGMMISKDADAGRLLDIALDLNISVYQQDGRQEDILLQAYAQHGPIFKDEIRLSEAIARLTDLLVVQNLWDALRPAEGKQLSENQRTLAIFSKPLAPDWLHDIMAVFLELDSNEKRLLAIVPGVRPASFAPVLPHERKYRLSFPPVPQEFPSREDKLQWFQQHVLRFFKKILQEGIVIDPAVREKDGNLFLMARPKDWYSFAALWLYLQSKTVSSKQCPGENCDNMIPIDKEYCSKCIRRYGDGYARSRVQTTYRVGKKIPDELYKDLKSHLGKVKKKVDAYGIPEGYDNVDKYFQDRAKQFVAKNKKKYS